MGSQVTRHSEVEAGYGCRWRRLWAASGALSVVMFACGLLFGDLLGSTNFPALDATGAELRAYFLQNASEVRALSFFHALSAIALVVFVAYLFAYLRRDDRTPPALTALALAAGAIAAAFLLLSALCYRTLAEPTVAHDAPLAHALVVLSYLAGGPAIAVPLALTVAVVSAAALRQQILARWISWLGATAAVCGVACVSVFLGPTNNHSATYGILLLGAVLMFAWLLAISVALVGQVPHHRHRPGRTG